MLSIAHVILPGSGEQNCTQLSMDLRQERHSMRERCNLGVWDCKPTPAWDSNQLQLGRHNTKWFVRGSWLPPDTLCCSHEAGQFHPQRGYYLGQFLHLAVEGEGVWPCVQAERARARLCWLCSAALCVGNGIFRHGARMQPCFFNSNEQKYRKILPLKSWECNFCLELTKLTSFSLLPGANRNRWPGGRAAVFSIPVWLHWLGSCRHSRLVLRRLPLSYGFNAEVRYLQGMFTHWVLILVVQTEFFP